MYNDTLAHLEENFTQKLGAIDDFMIRSKGVLNNMDLTNDANLIKGIELFNQWEKDNSAFFNTSMPVPELSVDNFNMDKDTFNFDFNQQTPNAIDTGKKSKFLDE